MSAAGIAARQNDAEHIDIARAFGRRYDLAGRWSALQTTISLALPALAIASVFLLPEAGSALGVIGGAWAVLGRFVVDRLEAARRLEGARAQECFDCSLFELPWNTAVAGPRPAGEDLIAWAKKRSDEGRYDWYPTVAPAVWPLDVLLCQRANAVWGRRSHDAYATAVAAGGWILFALTVAVAVIADLSIADYLVRLALPALPALLFAADLHTAHRAQAARRHHVERAAQTALNDAVEAGQPLASARCREIQDTLFLLRSQGSPVPGWFYRLRRADDEDAMRQTASALVAKLPGALRTN